MKVIPLIILFLSSIIIKKAQAYPNYIGHGYTSCINCHYNPFGGGPLSDYGRAVGATTISARHLYPKSVTDEKLSDTSGFLFNKPGNGPLRAQINYRGFQLVRNPGSSKNEHKTWINMQADAKLIFKFGEGDRVIAVGNVGYTPPPQNLNPKEQVEKWRSREYYLGVKVTPQIGLYAGLMDKIYGIRVVEHIAYSRTTPQVTQNDQTHGITNHFVFGKWEGGLQYFVGNLNQEEDLRMKGFAGTVERTTFDIHRIGASFATSQNEYLKLTSFALHGRFNLKEGSAVLFEVGQTTKTAVLTEMETTSRYGLFQTYLRLTRGLYVLSNIEYSNRDIKEDPYSIRWGPGIQYFPMQRLELRFDLYNTRNFTKETSTKDNWMYLLQTHVWL